MQLRSALVDALILLRSYEADLRDARATGVVPASFCRQPVYRRGRHRILHLNGLLGDPELASFAVPLEPEDGEDDAPPPGPLSLEP